MKARESVLLYHFLLFQYLKEIMCPIKEQPSQYGCKRDYKYIE